MTIPIVSVRGRKKTKPSKPRKDFPLFAHASGQWVKKVNGRIHYFGKWGDPTAAEAKWDRDRQALIEGRDPNDATMGDSVKWLCDSFMESKALQHERDELTKRAFNDYLRASKHVADFFGRGRRIDSLLPNDFDRYRNSLPGTWGPTTIDNHLRLVRVLFKYGNDIGAISLKPWTSRDQFDHLAFLTKQRLPWNTDGGTSHPLSLAFGKVKKAAGIDRKGVGHYSLRHTLETIAGDAKDQPAVDYIMGHVDNSMAGTYREGIDPERIKAVCEFVRRKWIEAKPDESSRAGGK